MDDMVLLPTEGFDEDRTEMDTMPWLDRQRRGGVRAWLGTVKMALLAPGRLMRAAPANGSAGTALWFAAFTQALIVLGFITPFFLFGWLMTALGGRGAPRGGPFAAFGIFALCLWVAIMAFLLSWGPVAHGLLRVTGPTPFTLRRTFQAICYSSGANVASALPCLGLFWGWIWWVVSAVLAVKEGHRVTGLRAALAVLAWPVFIFLCLIGLYGGFIYFAIRAAGSADANSSWNETDIVTSAVISYARAHEGRGPSHAAELLLDESLEPTDFVLTNTYTQLEHVRIGRSTLADYEDASAEERKSMVSAWRDGVPSDVIAHRLGDFVFLYDGIDLRTADPNLWVVIALPDPAVNPTSRASESTFVGRAGGDVIEIPGTTWTEHFASQNDLRARLGLPPLPDPATVLHHRLAQRPK
jgi:hypothetical protein